jgi:hypothetical protein
MRSHIAELSSGIYEPQWCMQVSVTTIGDGGSVIKLRVVFDSIYTYICVLSFVVEDLGKLGNDLTK